MPAAQRLARSTGVGGTAAIPAVGDIVQIRQHTSCEFYLQHPSPSSGSPNHSGRLSLQQQVVSSVTGKPWNRQCRCEHRRHGRSLNLIQYIAGAGDGNVYPNGLTYVGSLEDSKPRVAGCRIMSRFCADCERPPYKSQIMGFTGTSA
jgi:hypothetical protein